MGHTRLGVLPATRRWNEIRELLHDAVGAGAVGAATLSTVRDLFGDADRGQYGTLADDPAAVWAVWVLLTVPRAARLSDDQEDFRHRLAASGVTLPTSAYDGVLLFVAELTRQVRDRARADRFTTFSEVAVLALRETLLGQLGKMPLPLFDSAADDVRRSLAGFGTNRGFAALATAFFASLLERTITFYLSKELPQQVGPDGPFQQFSDLEPFIQDLHAWCRERAEITDDFASTWLSKQRFGRIQATGDESLALSDAKGFLSYALTKVGSEVDAHNLR